MTDQTKDLPPLPEKNYLGDDVSYGYDACDMREYALEAIRASATSAPVQPLTDEQIDKVTGACFRMRPGLQMDHYRLYARAIESAVRAQGDGSNQSKIQGANHG